jgi:ABC-2 type transport system permease protein
MQQSDSLNIILLRSFMTLLKREISRFLKIFVQTIFAPFLSNILFLAIFGGVLASRTVNLEIDFLSFLVPGLVFSSIVMASVQNPSFSIIAQKYQDTLKEYNLYPLTPGLRFFAFTLGGAIRGMIVGIMTWLAAGIFAGYSAQYPVLFWIYCFLLALLFSAIGTVFGLWLDSFEKMNFVVTILLTPLIYLGGIFFNVALLPGIWKTVGMANPFFVFIALGRFLYTGYVPPIAWPFWGGFALAIILLLVLFIKTARSSVGFQSE